MGQEELQPADCLHPRGPLLLEAAHGRGHRRERPTDAEVPQVLLPCSQLYSLIIHLPLKAVIGSIVQENIEYFPGISQASCCLFAFIPSHLFDGVVGSAAKYEGRIPED